MPEAQEGHDRQNQSVVAEGGEAAANTCFALLLDQVRHSAHAERIDDAVAKGARGQFAGHRKARHHQWLTDDVGNPALSQHLHAVITLMRVSKTWNQFKLMLDQAHPKRGDTLQLPLMLDGPDMPSTKPKKVEQKSLFDAKNEKASN